MGVFYLLVAWPLALGAGLVDPHTALGSPVSLLALALRVFLLPSLVEEAFFRVLLNPHPAEEPARNAVLGRGASSLLVYVLVHPLAGLLLRAPVPFFDPAFLLLTTLLGAACLLLYLRSGSIWPPVTLHWLVVTAWLILGGRGVLNAG
ncbi:MAG TPA: CPBP family glutamic-type intramembrane protease [Trueperaceae bacterium]